MEQELMDTLEQVQAGQSYSSGGELKLPVPKLSASVFSRWKPSSVICKQNDERHHDTRQFCCILCACILPRQDLGYKLIIVTDTFLVLRGDQSRTEVSKADQICLRPRVWHNTRRRRQEGEDGD